MFHMDYPPFPSEKANLHFVESFFGPKAKKFAYITTNIFTNPLNSLNVLDVENIGIHH